jgi:hypothetical protein
MTPADQAARHWDGRITRLIRDRENQVFEMATPTGAGGPASAPGGLSGAGGDPVGTLVVRGTRRGRPSGSGRPARARRSLLLPLSDGRHASAVAWMEGEALGEADKPNPRPLAEVLGLYQSLWGAAGPGPRCDRQVDPAPWLRAPTLGPRRAGRRRAALGPVLGASGCQPDQRATLIRARDALRERLGGRMGLIHADVLRENVLVNGRSVSLIDFDDSGFGFRLHDLGTALVQTVQHPEHPLLRDALMAGYGTTDTAMVEAFTLARTLASVGWTMPRLAPDDPIHRSHLARAVFCAERLLKSL